MKKLSAVEQAKNDATGKASDVARQLAFAGIAAIWVLRDDATKLMSDDMVPAAAFLVLALLFDALQYIVCSFIWTVLYNYHYEIHKSDEARVDIPGIVNWPGYGFFWLKLICLAIGWGYLGDAAVERIASL